MKRNSVFVWVTSLVLLMSSCNTTEQGAYNGAMFGSMIGSAIGGITGGWHGRDVGMLAGMAGGAIAGATVGKANEESRHAKIAERRMQRQREQEYQQELQDGYDPQGRGDDRITFDDSPSASATLEIRNPQVILGRDGVLSRGEEGRVVFEVFNNSSAPIYRVHPMVSEITGNKHIRISENVYVECIMPHQGIRYTAMVKADSRLKDGEAVIRIAIMQVGEEITNTLTVRTSKR